MKQCKDTQERHVLPAHLHLAFAHDLVHDLIVILVQLSLVVALLIAEDA